jgi:hypothetical protein
VREVDPRHVLEATPAVLRDRYVEELLTAIATFDRLVRRELDGAMSGRRATAARG